MSSKYQFLTSNEIKPLGWLKRQLEIEANGLCGNLDKVWPDVRDSKWIGGDREGWERVPYWLDGFIPLAYLLDNDDMKSRAKRYIDKILAFQQPDGWICPNGTTPKDKYDIWAVHLISKVLVVYYECSRDRRIPKAVFRIMKNFYEGLKSGEIRAFNWGQYRWFEGFIALNRLKEWYPDEKWIDELAVYLKETGINYSDVEKTWERPLNKWTYYTHVVNLAMMLKSEAVSRDIIGGEYTDLAEHYYQLLMKYNGSPTGIFTGDECLSGLSPIQGTELCAVVELMYSFEWLYAHTGDPKWAERLETVAFNALPATISDDMWSHQYVQLSNQTDGTPFPGKSLFRTNFPDAHIFGLEPNFGCCTANFGQGWPKLALSAFMKSDDGLISVTPIPSEVTLKRGKNRVKVTLTSNYPFENSFKYTVCAEKNTSMKLRVRIPSFAHNLTVNGSPIRKRAQLVFGGFKAGTTEITIAFDTKTEFISRPYSLKTVKSGSLIFSLPIEYESKTVEYEKNGVERKFPYCDYHSSAISEFNYAFTSQELVKENKNTDGIPFSSKNPPVVIYADMCHIDWGYEDGYEFVCAKEPNNREPLDEPRKMTLYPYGCTRMRMTEIPIIKVK